MKHSYKKILVAISIAASASASLKAAEAPETTVFITEPFMQAAPEVAMRTSAATMEAASEPLMQAVSAAPAAMEVASEPLMQAVSSAPEVIEAPVAAASAATTSFMQAAREKVADLTGRFTSSMPSAPFKNVSLKMPERFQQMKMPQISGTNAALAFGGVVVTAGALYGLYRYAFRTVTPAEQKAIKKEVAQAIAEPTVQNAQTALITEALKDLKQYSDDPDHYALLPEKALKNIKETQLKVSKAIELAGSNLKLEEKAALALNIQALYDHIAQIAKLRNDIPEFTANKRIHAYEIKANAYLLQAALVEYLNALTEAQIASASKR